jgi:O-antigen/teichoic acid export membrane protein
MIPSNAVMHARGEPAELGRVMIAATRYGTFLLLVAGLPLVLFARQILTVWVGPAYAARGANILQVLAIANIIRLSLTPYVVALIGTGQQRLVMLTPLMEGFSNLIVSVGLGYLFGAIGVALGTLCGSVVVFIGNIFYNMPRTTEIQFRLLVYLRDGFLRPLACAMPGLIFVLVIRVLPDLHPIFITFGAILAVLSSILCFWRWGLLRSERHKLRPRLIFAEGAGGS